MKIVIAGTIASIILACSSAAASGDYHLAPRSGQTERLHLSFAGDFWNGEHRAYEHDIVLIGESATTAAVTFSGKDIQTTTQTLMIAADGTFRGARSEDQVSALDSVALLLHGASTVSSSTFTLVLPTAVGSDSGAVPVPVRVTVARNADGSMLVQAIGSTSAAVSYTGFPARIDLAVRGAAKAVGGSFVRSDFAFDEVVHAGPQTQTLDWKWSLVAL